MLILVQIFWLDSFHHKQIRMKMVFICFVVAYMNSLSHSAYIGNTGGSYYAIVRVSVQ